MDRVIGPLAIVGACVAWGLDNNLTRKVSLADPLQIVMLKGLIAGPVNLILGLLIGAQLPGLSAIIIAGVVRREPHLVRHGLAESRNGANWRIFFDRPFPWQCGGSDCSR
jgi:hypothetical protein